MPVEPDVVVIQAGDALLDDPPRTVHVNVFAIARRPVTNAEYAAFVAATGASAGTWLPGADDRPAEGLSWADAVAYCRWLSVSTARIYRLPDEREWEKAVRTGALDLVGAVREWTNTWADGRVLKGGQSSDTAAERLPVKRFRAGDDLRGHGFRVVRSMTGR